MSLIETSPDNNLKLFINTRKHLLLSIVLVWGMVALIIFAIKPQFELLFDRRHLLAQEKIQYQSLIRKINELKQIEISQQFQQKEKVDEVLPSYKPILELLFNLNQAMDQTNVEIKAFKINPGEIATESAQALITNQKSTPTTSTTKQKKGHDNLKLEINVVGESENIDEFLKLVEQISPFTSIIELNIKKTLSKDRQATLTEAELKLHSYYYTQTITSNVNDQLPSVGDKELRAFETILNFMPSNFRTPTEIESTNLEDLFGIRGYF